MKHLNLAFAGVVAGSLALSAQAGTTEWWTEDFSGYSLDINAMTNAFTKGTWTMAAGDGSTLKASYSNEIACLGGLSAAPENVLALSTEGNDLTFAPTNATAVSGVTVVDADVFFVGSESAPSNLGNDVQFAMFLQVPEDGGDNAVMVYVNPEQEDAEWVALPNTSGIADKTWHHVQVKINYGDANGNKVEVLIDGSVKSPSGGYTTANGATTLHSLSSVSFRGTGAVDNFAGGWETVDPLPLHTFTASAYVDGVLDPTVEIAAVEGIQAGTDASFEVARTVGTKTIAKIVVKGFESASDTEYTVTDDGTDFTVTPSGLAVDSSDSSVVFITVPTDDAATTGAAQTYPALEVWYATPAAELTGLSKYLGSQVQGEGTAASPWQIPDLATLKALQAAVASNDVDCIGAYYVQTADIALDAAWPGIGIQNGKDIAATQAFDDGAFKGTYDGGNYTISNFQMVDGLDYCGLFNSVSNATIKNLKVSYKDGNFAKDMAAANDACGATFVGVAKGSTLQNLTTLSGSVSCTKGFGGIVGFLMAGSTVDSCTNNVNLTSTKTNKAGGIAMITQGGTGSAIIRNCQNNGTTTGNASQKGGIVGYVGVATTIENCEDTAGSNPSILHTQNYAVTVQGVNKAPANVVSYTNSGSTPVDGLAFATVDNGVATFVKVADLALGNTYKVMGPGAAYEFATTGSISFDEALVTPTVTAPGMVLSSSTSGNVTTYTATAAAARIGTTNYATFDEALAAAQAGDTITLLANVALTSTVTVDKNLTIDLNGNNVTATDCRAFHVTAGAFALTGEGTVSTVVTQGTSMDSSSSVIRVGSNTAATSFTLGEDVTVSSDYCYGVTYFGTQPQTVVLNGTVAVTGAQAAISGNGSASNAAVTLTVGETAEISATQDYAIYNPQTGTTTINGTVTGLGGVEVKAGTVTVGSTATITATGTPSYSQPNQDGTSTSGYAIAAVGNSAYQQPAAAVVQEGAMVTGTVIVLEENNSTTYGSITSDAELTAPTGYLWVAGEEAGTVELVKAFTVTFTTDHGTAPAAQTVANGAVATEPTAPEATGWTFKGWTLEGAAYSFSTPVTADITLVAAWEENAQPVKPQVNPGDNLPAGTAPMSFGADGKCTVRFIAPAAGTYVLLSSTTVDAAAEAWTADGTPVTVEAGATVELTEGTSAPAKFFKIGWEK